ncbi:hypothetical protein [Priestia megaterium]|uniref:hypothetical protein n=1 Tax=Priestia megaterium TaxID=1404 RepID=UPI000BF5A1DA|nr:hypothetical protein [Priestia megaterium]PFT49495.1 hypothetical protein COK68_28650 [Priestia megaterium]
MKIKKIGNIKVRVENNEEEILINDTYLQECINYIDKNFIKKVDISYPRYKDVDLEFLKQCPTIEEIALESEYLQDISGITHLKNLKVLSLSEETVIDGKNEIDLGKLLNLETLYLTWSKRIKGINKLLNLRELAIWKYKPKSKDLGELAPLKNLRKLILVQSNVENLNGISKLEKLRKVELNSLRKLNSLSDIKMLSEYLTNLEIESCKNVEDLIEIEHLERLESLTLANCGEISSIDFIKKLPDLKHLVFLGTNVLDGNLLPCVGINYVMFDNKKHYSHKIDFLNEIK